MSKDIFSNKKIRRFKINKFIETEDTIINESPLTLFINGYQFLTLMILKENLEELIIGFLAAEGIIKNKQDIRNIDLKYEKTVAMVEIKEEFSPNNYKKRTLTSGCGGGSTFINLEDCAGTQEIKTKQKYQAESFTSLMFELQQNSKYFQQTGGKHTAPLAS